MEKIVFCAFLFAGFLVICVQMCCDRPCCVTSVETMTYQQVYHTRCNWWRRCTRTRIGYKLVRTCCAGFCGTNCDIRDVENSCTSNPCQNGGTCTEVCGGYRCTCRPNYYGTNCQECGVGNPCTSNPCQNGGTCTKTCDGYRCVCRPQYYGINCQHCRVGNSCTPNPCQNGGTCTNTCSGYRCTCRPQYYGINCQHSPYDCTDRRIEADCLRKKREIDGSMLQEERKPQI